MCLQVGERWQCDALALMGEMFLKRSVDIQLKVQSVVNIQCIDANMGMSSFIIVFQYLQP